VPADGALRIAIPIFDQLTALDAVGPYEVLSRLPGAEVHFLAASPGAKRTENGMLGLMADLALAQLPEPDLIVVPGGLGTRALLADEEMLGWLRHAHEHSQWTTSVCTGSLLLAAAGILEGLEATSHWLELDTLRAYGATPVARRVVIQGKVITAAGVASGIDMALTLAGQIAGDELAHAIQLGIEYDPEPPFAGGTPATAPPEIVELVRRRRSELA
jgi:putative intracellular protease/amidase